MFSKIHNQEVNPLYLLEVMMNEMINVRRVAMMHVAKVELQMKEKEVLVVKVEVKQKVMINVVKVGVVIEMMINLEDQDQPLKEAEVNQIEKLLRAKDLIQEGDVIEEKEERKEVGVAQEDQDLDHIDVIDAEEIAVVEGGIVEIEEVIEEEMTEEEEVETIIEVEEEVEVMIEMVIEVEVEVDEVKQVQ